MSTLVEESLVEDIPVRISYPVPWRTILRMESSSLVRTLRMWRLALPSPVYSHDRTAVTIVVLLCGTFLLWHYGDSSPIVALVSSGWTLALTFWFRFGPNAEGGDG